MRKVILQMMTTLDGFLSAPDGSLDWMAFDPAMTTRHYEWAEHATAVMGFNLYQELAEYWPGAEKNPKSSQADRDFAKLMNDMPKLVISTRQEALAWTNATLLLATDDEEMVRHIQELKKQPGGEIVVYGGVNTARTFIEYDLIDEYRLDMSPIALGSGRALFPERTPLELISATPYGSGAVELIYRPKRSHKSLQESEE
ncbi:MAG TPA: dihydrofolate reductase family protein [Candidatus Saccharimonadales bacterium]|nr:dihydrofolate reductase family protein [Candidatus Saccharimonadales bacterium]